MSAHDDSRARREAAVALARAGVHVDPVQVEDLLWDAISAMLTPNRIGDARSDLTLAEMEALDRGGLTLEPVEFGEDDPLLRTAADYAALVATSLSVAETARMLGVNPSRVRQRLNEGTLYGFKVDGDWRVPRFQFAHNRPLPGIAHVFPRLARSLHPVAVYTWFTTPDVDLDIDDTPVSPQEWLQRGQPADEIAAIAADL